MTPAQTTGAMKVIKQKQTHSIKSCLILNLFLSHIKKTLNSKNLTKFRVKSSMRKTPRKTLRSI